MIRKTLPLAGVIGLAAMAPVQAQSFNQQIVNDLQSKGFESIEIVNGPTQTRVEALDGGTRLDVIYDNATGSILRQEAGRAGGFAPGREGVQIANAASDFLGLDDDSDDLSDDDSDDISDDQSEDDVSDDPSDDASDDDSDDSGGGSGGDDGSDDDSDD